MQEVWVGDPSDTCASEVLSQVS